MIGISRLRRCFAVTALPHYFGKGRRRSRMAHLALTKLTSEPLEPRLLLSVSPNNENSAVLDPWIQGPVVAVSPVTRAPDSAALVDPEQTISFSPDLRQEKVLPIDNESAASAPDADQVASAAADQSIEVRVPGAIPSHGDDKGAAKAKPTPEWVFGTDDRVHVGRDNMTMYPWTTIGRTWTIWPDGTDTVGTAAVIGHRTLLTVGHLVYSSAHGGWASQIYFSPGQDGLKLYDWFWDTDRKRSEFQFFGEGRATSFVTYNGWINNGDWNYDMAYVTLDRDIGDYTGWMGWGYNNNDSYFQNRLMNTAGYPVDIDPDHYDMWYTNGTIQTVNANNFQTLTDVEHGQSGSPFWNFDGSSRVMYAAASSGFKDGNGNPSYNQFTRITQSRFTDMQNQVANDGTATDLPDLVDYDTWFNTDFSFFNVGGGTISVTAYPRNNGTAAAGSFKVSFYASTNTTISPSDVLLGETTISSLAPFNWTEATWSGNLPNLPQGKYYVGWIIDSANTQGEFNEGDNTGYIAGEQLDIKRFDLDGKKSPTAAGYTGVQATDLYSPALGRGWAGGKVKGFDTKAANVLTRDGNKGKDATFRIALPAGSDFDATLYFYDKKASKPFDIFAEGTLAVNDLVVAKNTLRTVHVSGTVGGDGTLDLHLVGKGFILNGIDLNSEVSTGAASPTANLLKVVSEGGAPESSADDRLEATYQAVAVARALNAQSDLPSLDSLFQRLGQDSSGSRKRLG